MLILWLWCASNEDERGVHVKMLVKVVAGTFQQIHSDCAISPERKRSNLRIEVFAVADLSTVHVGNTLPDSDCSRCDMQVLGFNFLAIYQPFSVLCRARWFPRAQPARPFNGCAAREIRTDKISLSDCFAERPAKLPRASQRRTEHIKQYSRAHRICHAANVGWWQFQMPVRQVFRYR